MNNLPPRLVAALEGRYTVDHEIGAGGMATVYMAHDVRHERAVALKVLKPELSAVMGGERFLTEIRTTANLQHPHILPLYDSGNADGLLYYVMPYVEGETLRERLAREKQLSVDETLRIAKAVGSALDFAHRKGVVHRDIKPANILLQDGQPLVADFGIALAVAQAGGGRLTETGLSLGTPHYMSPEQATADRDPDARSDIYSLACVVYEMLTGEPPHLGGNAQAVLARILTETARSVRDVRDTVPVHMDAALTKALRKLPADRFDTAADFLAALEGRVMVDTGATAPVTRSGRAPEDATRSWTKYALAGAALIVGLFAGWLAHRPAPAAPPPLVRMYLQGDSSFTVTNTCCGPSVAISRDGQRIGFMAKTSKGREFYVRALDEADPQPVEGSESAFTLFFDPTGRWLGFVKDDRLMKADLAGGTPVTVASVGTSAIWGASWSDDGFIYYTPRRASTTGVFRVNAQGGSEELVSAPDTSVEANRVSPWALPGGRGLLYVSWPASGGDAEAWVCVLDLEDGSSRRLTPGVQPRYADGHLVYAMADGSIMTRPFDLDAMEVTGDAVRLSDDVITHDASDTEYSVSLSGTLVTRHAHDGTPGGSNVPSLRFFKLAGQQVGRASNAEVRASPTFSPDGRSLAFVQARDATGNLSDVWVMDLDNYVPTRLSTGDIQADSPIWSTDGRSVRWVEYGANNLGKPAFVSRAADLSGPPTPFAAELAPKVSGSLAGSRLGLPSRSGGPIPVVVNSPDGTSSDVWLLDADGTHPRAFIESPSNEKDPAISPSGDWIAYASDEAGQMEIWVEPFPDRGARFRLTTGGGEYPVWVDDHQLLYMRDDVVVLVELDITDGRVRARESRDVTDLVATPWSLRPLDVSARDQRVAVVSQNGTSRLLVETNRLSHLEGTK